MCVAEIYEALTGSVQYQLRHLPPVTLTLPLVDLTFYVSKIGRSCSVQTGLHPASVVGTQALSYKLLGHIMRYVCFSFIAMYYCR